MKLSNLQQTEFMRRAENLLSDSKVVFLIFTLVGFAVFGLALPGDFVGDDIARILADESRFAKGLVDVLTFYSTDRPLVMFTVWLNYKMGGVSPLSYKLTNLFFHLLCVQAGFLLLRRLFSQVSFKNLAAFFASGIFLVHPLNYHVVQSAVQRSVSMAGLFSILSFIYFIDFYDSRNGRKFTFSMFLFLMAILCKPTAIALPAVLFVYLYMEKARMADMIKWISAYFIFFAIPLWNYFGTSAGGGDSAAFKFEHWRYFLIQTKVFFIYLKKFFFPFPMEFIHSIHNSAEKIYAENFIPYFLVYLLIFAMLGGWFFRKRSLTAALFLMAYVFYLPQSSFYSIIHVLFYHRLYLSILLGSGAVVYFLFEGQFFKNFKPATFVLLSSAMVYFSASSVSYFAQVKTYSDWLWYNIQANPENQNFNISTLFMLKRRNYPPEQIEKFSEFIGEHNSGKEIDLSREMATYVPNLANAKKTVLDVATFLSTEQTTNNFFQGAMFFLETEAPRFFPADQAVLSLNSLYFSRLDSSVVWSDANLKAMAKASFNAVLQIQKSPSGVTPEKLAFLKLRSRVVLLTVFGENWGLNVEDAKALLQSQYRDLPESKWLLDKLQNVQ